MIKHHLKLGRKAQARGTHLPLIRSRIHKAFTTLREDAPSHKLDPNLRKNPLITTIVHLTRTYL